MRFRTFALASFFVAAVTSASHAAILVQIDKTSQSVTVSRDGDVLHRWPVSTGKRGHDTPNGTYKAFRMEKDHFSKEWDDAPMPNSIFFTKRGHALHGSFDVKNIGRPASHGCVRLRPENAATLFSLVQQEGVLNTTVSISGELPAASPAVARANPRGVAPDGQTYQPADPNYPRYGAQEDYNQPRYPAQRYAPRYSYDERAPQPRYGRSYDPRYRYQQYDPRYADDDGAPVYVQPRRYQTEPLFPFGGN
jgi:hypothetical protein